MKINKIVCDICGEDITGDYIELLAVEHTTIWYEHFRTRCRIALCEECKDSLVKMVKNQREWEKENEADRD